VKSVIGRNILELVKKRTMRWKLLRYKGIDGELVDKVRIATDRILGMQPRDGSLYYLAFSGGKDSIVIYELMKKSGLNFEPHFHFTTVDPPELTRFIKDNYEGVVWDRPKKSMFKLIEERGFPPTRNIRYCCDELKEYGGRGRTIVTGVRWEESQSRSKRRLYERCEKHKATWYLNPIIDWSSEDVWEFIRTNNLNYCSLYDEGFTRIGCIMCPKTSSEQMHKEAKRWPKFYKAYLRALGRALETLKRKGRTSTTSGKTPEEYMEWWMDGVAQDGTIQCELFG
jgi:phosphoadenosine phosphosulfate reductase